MSENELSEKLLGLTDNENEKKAIKEFLIMVRCLLKHELLRKIHNKK